MANKDKKELSHVKVIQSIEEIDRIREVLRGKPRDLLLFDLAVQTGLKMKDLLKLHVHDLIGLKVGDRIPISSTTGDGPQAAVVTDNIFASFQVHMEQAGLQKEDYLFQSKRTSKPLDIATVSRLVSSWYKSANLAGLSGYRSLRMTWLYFNKQQLQRDTKDKKDPISSLKPLKQKALNVRVYNELFEAIVSGKIPPGRVLTTDRIAKQMQVSQMPVREALNKLASRGFISSRKKKGSVVNELSRETLYEILQIRLNLESMAIRKACISITRSTLDRLEQHRIQFSELLKEEASPEELLRASKEFFFTIYAAANMPTLLSLIDQLRSKVSPYIHILLGETLDYSLMLRTHREILDALEQKNQDKAEKWLRIDLMESVKIISLRLRDDDQLPT